MMPDWFTPELLDGSAAFVLAVGSLVAALAAFVQAWRATRRNGREVERMLGDTLADLRQANGELRSELHVELEGVHAQLEDCLEDRQRLALRLDELEARACVRADCPMYEPA